MIVRHIGLLLLCVLCTACATSNAYHNRDPLEKFNRGVYQFNTNTDKMVIKPIAKAYKAIAPTPVRKGINNFFGNLRSLTTVVNDLLQLKFKYAVKDAGRLLVNTVFGVGGIIDVASKNDPHVHYEDFGQTLSYWGVAPGPYVVLPLLGPSTFTDTAGLTFDTITTDPLTYLHNGGRIAASNLLRVGQFIDKRTELLTATNVVDGIALDAYVFTRESYFQYRQGLVKNNGDSNARTRHLETDELEFE